VEVAPTESAAHVQDYVTGVAYRSNLELVAREYTAYACAAPVSEGRGGDLHGSHHGWTPWRERGEGMSTGKKKGRRKKMM